jgi:hypothetical protein
MGSERRRGARIKCKLWVEIQGVSKRITLRETDISISGIFLEVDEALGRAGHVQKLNLATIDRLNSISLLVRLVRVITIDDIWRGKVKTGAAWEFLFQKDEQRREIERFIRVVAELKIKGAEGLDVAYQYRAQVNHNALGLRSALVSTIWLKGMLIETDWPIQQGEMLNVEIEAPASKKKMRFVGQTTSRKKLEGGTLDRYQVEVTFARAEPTVTISGGDTIMNAVDQLLLETATWQPDMSFTSHGHLKGDLEQIPLTSMLSFIELERMSGIFRLEQDSNTAKFYISDGRVVDAESLDEPNIDPSQLISTVLQWTRGMFEFRVEKVERDDRVGMPVSAMLLNLARIEDESRSLKTG